MKTKKEHAMIVVAKEEFPTKRRSPKSDEECERAVLGKALNVHRVTSLLFFTRCHQRTRESITEAAAFHISYNERRLRHHDQDSQGCDNH